MTPELNITLEHFEQLMKASRLSAFTVYIQEEGLLVRAKSQESDHTPDVLQHIDLLPEIMESIRIFFFEVEAIEYGTFDYDTLKGILNAGFSDNHLTL